jgi:hypothetical protein
MFGQAAQVPWELQPRNRPRATDTRAWLSPEKRTGFLNPGSSGPPFPHGGHRPNTHCASSKWICKPLSEQSPPIRFLHFVKAQPCFDFDKSYVQLRFRYFPIYTAAVARPSH